jgi:hypothetical protein
MSKPDDNLTNALSGNGAFDPDKAKELQTKTVSSFEAKMRKVERYLFAYMCICCWLVVFSVFQFLQSSTTKALLFYGLLLLVFFGTTVLMKLWYWIMNNKISVLKEIKLLELAALPDQGAGAAPRTKRLEGPLSGLSRRERTVWWAVLLAGGALIGVVKGLEITGGDDAWSLGRGGSLRSEGSVTLAADGSGSAVTEMSWIYQGMLARRGFTFFAAKGAVLRFTDSHGRELPFTTSEQQGHVRYDVSLLRPVMPGRPFSYTRFEDAPRCATEKEGLWTFSTDYSYGYETNEFSQMVVLPQGAEIVSVTPWPVATFTLEGRPTVRFEATRGRNEPFRYTVQYRLRSKPAAQTGADSGD